MIPYPKITTNEINKREFEKKITYSGLPFEVNFCKKCVISNQRPTSTIEYKHTPNSIKETISFNEDGICDACCVKELKEKEIDWEKRERELVDLCEKYRGNGKDYDCIVPGSGGKDSFYVSHMLKYKYNMNPLTITWAPHIYTPTGLKNMENWVNAGFDNYLVTPNRKIQRLLTRLSLENLFHPFQPFQFGQKFLAPKLALKLGINLIFYGENGAEYGNASGTLQSAKMDSNYYSIDEIEDNEIFIGGESLTSLKIILDY
jgi:N-acetyl sugar amidotransferase